MWWGTVGNLADYIKVKKYLEVVKRKGRSPMLWWGIAHVVTRDRPRCDKGSPMLWRGIAHAVMRDRPCCDKGSLTVWRGIAHGVTRDRPRCDEGSPMVWRGIAHTVTRDRPCCDEGAPTVWLYRLSCIHHHSSVILVMFNSEWVAHTTGSIHCCWTFGYTHIRRGLPKHNKDCTVH